MFNFCIIFINHYFFCYFEELEREISSCWFKPYKPLYNANLKLTFNGARTTEYLSHIWKKFSVITLMLEIMNKESSKFFSQVADVTVVTEVFNHLL